MLEQGARCGLIFGLRSGGRRGEERAERPREGKVSRQFMDLRALPLARQTLAQRSPCSHSPRPAPPRGSPRSGEPVKKKDGATPRSGRRLAFLVVSRKLGEKSPIIDVA